MRGVGYNQYFVSVQKSKKKEKLNKKKPIVQKNNYNCINVNNVIITSLTKRDMHFFVCYLTRNNVNIISPLMTTFTTFSKSCR